jgi:hypothetical protein
VSFAADPVFDVEMNRPVAGLEPAFPGIVAAKNVVGRVVHRSELWMVERGQQIQDSLRGIAVDAMFVFVEQANTSFLGNIEFATEPVEYFAAIRLPIEVTFGRSGRVRGIVAENANVAGLEDLAELDRASEALQVRLEGIADLDLADR